MGQYLGSNESFIHGVCSALGQKQWELVQQARFHRPQGPLSTEPPEGLLARRAPHMRSPASCGRPEAETRAVAGKSLQDCTAEVKV